MNKVYEIITNRIIEQIEKDPGRWTKGWKVGHHKNLVSKQPYQGINALLTMIEAETKGYKSEYWLTRKQIEERGGVIKQGERYLTAVFFAIKPKKQTSQEIAEGKKPETYRVLMFYKIYNLDQVEGINAPLKVEAKPIISADRLLDTYPDKKPEFNHNTVSAYYSPTKDLVSVPHLHQFNSPEEYYSVLYHEYVHSTGHQDRLNRFAGENSNFGSSDYSREELVAELGATFLCAEAGLENKKAFQNSIAYLNGWLSRLKKDPQLIIQAAGKAQKATNYILGR